MRKLFSGAPHFLSVSEGHCIGPPHPTILFPWDSEQDIKNIYDHQRINDDAWGSMTAWPDVTGHIRERLRLGDEHYKKQVASYMPLCRERPHMPSTQGLERGTIGYTAALELGVADARPRPVPSPGDTMAVYRNQLLGRRDGLRPFTGSVLVNRLISASTTYRTDREYHLQPPVILFTELFTHVLFPPTYVTDSRNPYSLQVQINILIDILSIPVWIDFSIVEWRMRLGEVLWGPPVDSNADDQLFIDDGIAQKLGNQKFWLLIQILLSCELLLRLDAKSTNIGSGREAAQLSDIKHIDEAATESVRWSLVVARLWLDNIVLEVTNRDIVSPERPSPGWLATLSKTGSHGEETVLDRPRYVRMQCRNRDRQLSGLLHFARELRWPNADALATKIASHRITISDSFYESPVASTPSPVSSQGTNSYSSTYIPGKKRGQKRGRATAAFYSSGWLSNSYISGLVLPGEGLSHFLICTLLDNDEKAVSRLGREANLYSGFSYCGRSFWSNACVVGRVLAGGKGAAECVGWISSHVVPKGLGDVWVDIDVAPLPLLGNLPHFTSHDQSFWSFEMFSRPKFTNCGSINRQKKTE